MKKVIIVPDSFKGGMSSQRICALASEAVLEQFPLSEIVCIPVADGGEGTVDAMLFANGGKRVECIAQGPFGDNINSFYGILPDGTAVVEMAAAAGLPLASGQLNPLTASTFGVGQLMLHAVNNGCKSIILAMGGSCTNDAGCGMAVALGVKFYTENGEAFVPTGGTLHKIHSIDTSGFTLDANVVAMCDIDNPLYGENGAAYVFSPQKGADTPTIALLDDGLRHFATIVKKSLNIELDTLAGGGAAGGLGAGAVCFLNAELKMGIEAVLDIADFNAKLLGASLVITGEGRIDTQSLRGKVVIGVSKRAKACNVPVIAIVGDVGDNVERAYDLGVTAIFSINRVAVEFEKAVKRSEKDLRATLGDIMRFAKIFNAK